jgi:hypothetical protein
MKRVMFVVLLAAILFAVFAPMAAPAKADGPWGYPGYVFPNSGYNKVCMYSYWNCSYRFVPPYPVSGWYYYPYNTYRPAPQPRPQPQPYNPNWCTPGLLCGNGY